MSEKNDTTPTSIPGRGVKRKMPENVTTDEVDSAENKLATTTSSDHAIVRQPKLSKSEVANIIRLVAERKNGTSNALKTAADRNEIILVSDDEEVAPDMVSEMEMEPEMDLDGSMENPQEKDPLAVESVLESVLKKEQEPMNGSKCMLGESQDSSSVPFACAKCGAQFHLMTNLTQHLRICKEKPKPPVQFMCGGCHKTFRSPYLLNLHSCSSIPKPFQCDQCKQMFKFWRNLFYHKRPHVRRPHRCDRCCKTFQSVDALNTHVTRHEKVGIYFCLECEEKFSTRHLLFYHMQTHKDGANMCTKCRKMFKNPEDLKKHSSQCVTEKTYVRRMPYKCYECNLWFQTSEDLKCHRECHVDKVISNNCQGDSMEEFNSDNCSESLKNDNESLSHSYSHIVKEPYKCNLCGEKFQVIQDLTSHLALHYRCSLCNKKFNSSWALSRHTCPKQYDSKVNFYCSKCDSVFCSLQRLFDHAKSIHYTDPQDSIFYCYTCEVIFTYQELHTPDKGCRVEKRFDQDEVFKCKICKVTFAYSYESFIHNNVHHMTRKLFDCNHCASTFISEHHLKRHIIEQHGQNVAEKNTEFKTMSSVTKHKNDVQIDRVRHACVCNDEASCRCDNVNDEDSLSTIDKPTYTDSVKSGAVSETVSVPSDQDSDIDEEVTERETIPTEGVEHFTDIEKQDNETTTLVSDSKNFFEDLIIKEEFEIEAVTVSRLITPESSSVSGDRTFHPRDIFHFDWSEFPFPTLENAPHNRREVFRKKTGPVRRYGTPYDAFTAIWDKTLIEHMVNETNKYAHQTIRKLKASKSLVEDSSLNLWTDTNIDELYVYLGIVLATGMFFKSNIKEYWTDSNFSSVIDDLSQYMDFNRFLLLSTFLHFADSNIMNLKCLTPSEAKVYNIDPIVKYLNKKFKKLYRLNQNIVIDDSLARWKRCARVKKSIGIVTCEVYDCRTGYMWGFLVDTDREENAGASAATSSASPLVLRLLAGLKHRGHTVYTDESYSRPALARFLKATGFDCVGALRTSARRAGDSGRVRGCTSGDVDVLIWSDCNELRAALSTYHGDSMCQATREPPTPLIAYDYNTCTKAIEDKNRSLSIFPIEREWIRVWYKKLFLRLINVSAMNSLILYKYSDISDDTTRRLAYHREFRSDLISAIFERHKATSTSILKDLLIGQS